MNCPFCKAGLDLAIQDLNQVYYDCPSCESSLFIENGKCELVSEGRKKASPASENLKTQTQEKALQTKEVSQSLYKEKEEKEESASPPYEEEVLREERAGLLPEESAQEEEQEVSHQTKPFQTREQKLDSIQEEGEPADSFSSVEEQANPSLKELSQVSSFQEEEVQTEEPAKPNPEDQEEEQLTDNLSTMTNLEEEILPEEMTEVPELYPPGEEEKELSKGESPVDLKESSLEKESDSSAQDSSEEERSRSFSQNFAKEDQKPFSKTVESHDFNEEEKAGSEKEDFSEVAQFGNTQNEDREGPFLYNLLLSEINSKNVKQEVLSVLNNESLNLKLNEEEDFDKILESGQILIEKISPLKTYVIVHSLMGLPLNISWTQQHIAESDRKHSE